MKKLILIFMILISLTFVACAKNRKETELIMNNVKTVDINKLGSSSVKEIYLAGGCFWGVEGYFQRLDGILETEVGYANGNTEETTYEDLKKTDHVEALYVKYDENKISLTEIVDHLFRIIDPTSVDKQGGDIGRQYRTGIYSTDDAVLDRVKYLVDLKRKDYDKEIVVEIEKLNNYITGEEYHQDYLEKNPMGYCHVDLSLADVPLYGEYEKPTDEVLKERLTEEQYYVTQEAGTERPFTSEYDKFDEKGIYVDITTGEPLFSSEDKYDAGCGWPSFTKPLTSYVIDYHEDLSLGRNRVEVKSKSGDSHLGHVFEDGPEEEGGLRYCINGASLVFVPYDELDEQGYGEFKKYFE